MYLYLCIDINYIGVGGFARGPTAYCIPGREVGGLQRGASFVRLCVVLRGFAVRGPGATRAGCYVGPARSRLW